MRNYLEQMRWLWTQPKRKLHAGVNFYGLEDYLLDKGSAFFPRALESQESAAFKAALKRLKTDWGAPVLGCCFENSLRLVLADRTGTLSYVEGYATGIIPVHHAWVTYAPASVRPVVIDVTWTLLSKEHLERFPFLERQYFGVAVHDRRRLRAQLKRDGMSLFGDYRDIRYLKEPRNAPLPPNNALMGSNPSTPVSTAKPMRGVVPTAAQSSTVGAE